ncbi:MAG: hypothetical protein H6510_04030, partial [Acidobacteria bacterium]|nr:hypothetical protein [Acidobacteriota bacterium]
MGFQIQRMRLNLQKQLPLKVGLVLGLVGSSAGMLLGALGRWIAFFDLFAHYRIFYLVCQTICLIPLLLIWTKRIWVLFLLPLSWGVVDLVQFHLLARPGACGPGFRVLHMNVHTSNPNKLGVIRWIQKQKPDLLNLQEIDSLWAETVRSQLPEYEPVRVQPRSDNFGIGLWVRKGSGIRVEGQDLLHWPPENPQIPIITARLNWQGVSFDVLSLHTLPPVGRFNSAFHSAQIQAAQSWLQAHGGQTLLVGDLNASRWGAQYAKLHEGTRLHSAARGFPLQNTWHGLGPIWAIPIDHILLQGSWC